jgi:hypothetical protein
MHQQYWLGPDRLIHAIRTVLLVHCCESRGAGKSFRGCNRVNRSPRSRSIPGSVSVLDGNVNRGMRSEVRLKLADNADARSCHSLNAATRNVNAERASTRPPSREISPADTIEPPRGIHGLKAARSRFRRMSVASTIRES